jgi:hypothetical protein
MSVQTMQELLLDELKDPLLRGKANCEGSPKTCEGGYLAGPEASIDQSFASDRGTGVPA